MGLGETFKANKKAKDILEMLKHVQKVLNENLLVYKRQNLQKAYLADMDLNVVAGLNLVNRPSVQHDMYSYLVFSAITP